MAGRKWSTRMKESITSWLAKGIDELDRFNFGLSCLHEEKTLENTPKS